MNDPLKWREAAHEIRWTRYEHELREKERLLKEIEALKRDKYALTDALSIYAASENGDVANKVLNQVYTRRKWVMWLKQIDAQLFDDINLDDQVEISKQRRPLIPYSQGWVMSKDKRNNSLVVSVNTDKTMGIIVYPHQLTIANSFFKEQKPDAVETNTL